MFNILNWIFDKWCPCLTHKNMRINELSTQDMKDINKSLKEFEEGKFTTQEEMKRKYGL